MSVLRGLEVPAVLFGALGFMYHTDYVFNQTEIDLKSLAHITSSKLSSLKRYMKIIQNECTRCNQDLIDMNEALLQATTIQSFDNVNLVEMSEVCQTLFETFKLLDKTLDLIYEEGQSFNKNVLKMMESFNSSYSTYTNKYNAMGAFLGALTGYAIDKIILYSVAGMFVGAGTTTLAMYCTSYSKSCTRIILNKIYVDINKINETADNSRTTMYTIVEKLREQLENANKNERTGAQSGTRVKKQADKMIENINLLQDALREMKEKAQVNKSYIKRILHSENVVDLLNL